MVQNEPDRSDYGQRYGQLCPTQAGRKMNSRAGLAHCTKPDVHSYFLRAMERPWAPIRSQLPQRGRKARCQRICACTGDEERNGNQQLR